MINWIITFLVWHHFLRHVTPVHLGMIHRPFLEKWSIFVLLADYSNSALGSELQILSHCSRIGNTDGHYGCPCKWNVWRHSFTADWSQTFLKKKSTLNSKIFCRNHFCLFDMTTHLLQNMPSGHIKVKKREWPCILHVHSLSHYWECKDIHQAVIKISLIPPQYPIMLLPLFQICIGMTVVLGTSKCARIGHFY